MRKLIGWLNPQPLVSIEQHVLIVFGSATAAAGVAAPLGEDIETWIFRYGLLAGLLLSLALDLYYRRRYRPKKRSQ